MTKQKMINKMIGKKLILSAEWLEKNEPEMLDWIVTSKYWGRGYSFTPKRSDALVELHFNEEGVEYYGDFDGSFDRYPSQNQPPWGADNWLDWAVEDVEKFYSEVVKNNEK